MIEPDEYTLLQMKNEAVKITSEDRLNTPQSVQLFVTNPKNNVEVIIDSEEVLQILFTLHDALEVIVFEVIVLPTLRPDLPLGGVIQAMLHSLGVNLSAEQITSVNDSENEVPPTTARTHGP